MDQIQDELYPLAEDKAVDFPPPDDGLVVVVAEDDESLGFPYVTLRKGVMGEPRIQLMRLLGLEVNHAFDDEVEEILRSKFADFEGTVTEEQWVALVETDPLAQSKG